MNILRQLKKGKDRFYLSELTNFKNIKAFAEVLKVGQEIDLSAKTVGGGYRLSLIKKKKGFCITNCSEIGYNSKTVYKSLKRLLKEAPKPAEAYNAVESGDLDWMNRC